MIDPGKLVFELGLTLARWMAAQRWFRHKARGITHLDTRAATMLLDGDAGLAHLRVIVDDTVDYQLVLGLRRRLPRSLEHALIGRVGKVAVYDAIHDARLMANLLERLAADDDAPGLRLRREPGVTLDTRPRSRPIGVEQSNTSIVFGDRYILKLYRQPEPGPNRDVELHRALRSAGSPHIAAPLGVISTDDGEGTVLGFLQEFLPDAVEGWATATASVRDLLAEADLHADEVGGDFAGEAHRLGTAVAEVHAALAGALGTTTLPRDAVGDAIDAMHARLSAVIADVPELAAHEKALRAAFEAAREHAGPLVVQQVHGDLHLGQVLRTTAGWKLIDFEGEPAATVEQRRARRTPLRDVAAMLFSFDFASLHLLAGEPDGPSVRQLATRAAEWSDRNRAAFCDGYAQAGPDPREQGPLLHALELDQAVYEVFYEHHNRPDWRVIPLAAIGRRS